jgi:hypothetical protein
MTASLSGVFSIQEFTDLGVLGVGMRLYTYAQGTTTHKTAYTDAAGSVAHTYTSDGAGGQYIALDARGELPAPLYLTAGSYDIALKTASGATVWTRRADPDLDVDTVLRADIASDTSEAKGAGMTGFSPTLNYAVATIGKSLKERGYSCKDSPWNCVGDGSNDDSAAWTAWSNYVQAHGRRGYIPDGIYLIDSWSVTTRGCVFEGANPSAVTLTNGVKIKARSTVTNFVTWESSDSRLANVELDGNNKATNVLRMANQTFNFLFDRVYVGGAVDDGINVNLSGTTTNTQVAEGRFCDCFVAGCGSRAGTGASGITNVKINSNQSLVLSFYQCKFQGNDTSGTDILEQVNIPLGTVSFFGCFWTQGNAAGHDVRIGDGGTGGGAIGLYDCRSESTLSDSIYADGGAGDVVLSNFTHATSAKTGLTTTNAFTGRVTVIGGQQYLTTNSSSSAQIVLINMRTLAGGSVGGAYADRVIQIVDGISISARRAAKQKTVTYSASMTLEANQYDRHYILVANGTAFTLNAPTGPTAHQTIVIDIQNGSGGAMGTITWNGVFKLAGSFTNPANTTRRKIAFTYDGTSWVEDWRMAADGAA